MSFQETITAHWAVNMPDGLLGWARSQGAKSWHDIAHHCDFADVRCGVDPLLAAFWITRQPGCDRATALLFLAKAIAAGFLDQPPAHHDLKACSAFARWLHLRLDDGEYPCNGLALNMAETALVRRHLGPSSRLALPKSVRSVGAVPGGTPSPGGSLRALAALSSLRAAIGAA
jgi:hypothetical protein